MNKNKKNGFTLIELLVVIVIIGILSGIGISSFNSYQLKAHHAKRLFQLKDSQTAWQAKCINNQSIFCNDLSFDNLIADPTFSYEKFWNNTNTTYGNNNWEIENNQASNQNNISTNFDFLSPYDENGNSFQIPAGDYLVAIKVSENSNLNHFGFIQNGTVRNLYNYLAHELAQNWNDGYYLIEMNQSNPTYFTIYNTNTSDLILDEVFLFEKQYS